MSQKERIARILAGSTVGDALRHELTDLIDSTKRALVAMNSAEALCCHVIQTAGGTGPSEDNCTARLAEAVRETLRLAFTVLEDAHSDLGAIRDAKPSGKHRPPGGTRPKVVPLPTRATP